MNNKNILKLKFKPATPANRSLIHFWLSQDYIAKWIHGIGLENTLKGLEKFFLQEGEDTEHKAEITQHWVGYDNDKPFVYLLTSNLFSNVPNDYTKYSENPSGVMITVDIFIGDSNYVGKGFGAYVIQEFLVTKFSDVSEVFIDPEKTNTRAIHVYEKVGFKKVGEFIAPWHPVPHYIMKLKMTDLKN